MTRTLRPTALFCFLLTLLFSSGFTGCRSLSSEIRPSEEVSRTVMVTWEHDYHNDLIGAVLTCGLPDGRLLAISRSHGVRHTLHAWSSLLMKLYEVRFSTERSEENLALLHGAGRTVLLSQEEMRDDEQVVRIRDLDTESGTFSDPREILRTDPEFNRRLLIRRSPDRRRVLLYGFSDNLASRRDKRKGIDYRTRYAVVLDMASGEVWQTRDTLRYDDIDDGRIYRTATISNDGNVGILELVPTDDERYDLVAHRIDERGSSLHRFALPARRDSIDPNADDTAHMNPYHIVATFAADGSLIAATTLEYDNIVRTICTIVLTPDFSRATFDHPMLYDEEVVEKFSNGMIKRLHYTYGAGDIVAHDDGTITVILDAQAVRSHFTTTPSRTYLTRTVTAGPILVARIDPEKESIDHRFIYRNERWKNDHLAYTEAGINRMSFGDSLFLILRNRGSEAVNFYALDYSRDSVEQTPLAQLDDMALYAAGMTVWHSPNEISLFAKRGENGRDWFILRIRR